MDVLSIVGIILGISAILVGQHLEGGHMSALVNGPALLIVFGGTIGAVMLQSPLATFVRGMRLLSWTFVPPKIENEALIEKIIAWSHIARKEGLLGLENIEEAEKRSEEHTSELQSPDHLVCRLLLEKKKNEHATNDYV